MSTTKNILIIGGGISGCLTALELSNNKNYTIHLYEKNTTLLTGPPYCHLHAGGFLYPDMNIHDCQELLYDSILFASKFPNYLFKRPTIIAYNISSNYSTDTLLYKAQILQYIYYIHKQYIFGPPHSYYATYTKNDIIFAKKYGKFQNTINLYHDKYALQFIQLLDDINSIKYPIISVCEYGIDQDKLKHNIINTIESTSNIKVFYNQTITHNSYTQQYDKIINASGWQSYLQNNNNISQSFELKSSWMISLTKTNLSNPNIFPEICIIGERSTNNGMIQISPIPSNTNILTFQIHCMTYDSTLFKNGLLTYNDTLTNYTFPSIHSDIISTRTNNSIKHISKFFPIFKHSKSLNIALYGIQRIYNNINKRTSFCIFTDNYIEIFLLKGISSVKIAQSIYNNIT